MELSDYIDYTPHSMHVYQALDVGVFGALKTYWGEGGVKCMLSRLGRPTFLKSMVMLASILQLPVYRVCGKKPGLYHLTKVLSHPRCLHQPFHHLPMSIFPPTNPVPQESFMLSSFQSLHSWGCVRVSGSGFSRAPKQQTWAQPAGWPPSHQVCPGFRISGDILDILSEAPTTRLYTWEKVMSPVTGHV